VFFCTDQGFGIEMVQALVASNAIDIVHAHQPEAWRRCRAANGESLSKLASGGCPCGNVPCRGGQQ
jgi:hypothetical protein